METALRPSAHMVFMFTSAMSKPEAACKGRAGTGCDGREAPRTKAGGVWNGRGWRAYHVAPADEECHGRRQKASLKCLRWQRKDARTDCRAGDESCGP
eukprot:scaffold19092_cov90-Isochrysis_galbana.AAC.3